jgi:hypothetical protein
MIKPHALACLVRAVVGATVLMTSVVGMDEAAAQCAAIDPTPGVNGYGTAIGKNDDGSTGPVSLASVFPEGINYFGSKYSELFLNTNGNVSFGGPSATFTPVAFPLAGFPSIAPFLGDVDTRAERGAGRNTIYYAFDTQDLAVDGTPRRMIVTWFDVDY